MCFSATASFSAAIVLGVIGLLALRTVRQRAYYGLAMVPLLFAVQQAAEGMVWVTNGVQPWWVYFYLSFVLLVWPVWTPFSVWLVETHKNRAAAQLALMILGACGSAAYLIQLFVHGATATVDQHILYHFAIPAQVSPAVGLAAYLLIVVGSCLLSSKRLIALCGLLVCAAALVTIAVWNLWFTSIWCFCGAVLSIGVYGIIRVYNKGVA